WGTATPGRLDRILELIASACQAERSATDTEIQTPDAQLCCIAFRRTLGCELSCRDGIAPTFEDVGELISRHRSLWARMTEPLGRGILLPLTGSSRRAQPRWGRSA